MGDYALICKLRGSSLKVGDCMSEALRGVDLPYCGLRAPVRRTSADPQYNCVSGDISTMHYDDVTGFGFLLEDGSGIILLETGGVLLLEIQ